MGHRASQGEVLLAGVAPDEGGEGRQEDGEEGGPLLAGDPARGRGRRRRNRHLEPAAPVAAHRGPGPVGGELQGRQAGEPPAPEGELRGERVRGVAAALPGREVGILDRRLGEPGAARRAARPLGVERRELVRQHPGRPAVRDDVVEVDHQGVVAGRQAQEPGAEQRRPREIERVARLPPREPGELGLPGRRSEPGEVDDGEGERPGVLDHLDRLAVPLLEAAPQHPVAPDDRRESSGQRRGDQLAAEPQPARDVVLRRAGLEAVEEPEPALRGGQGEGTVAGQPLDRLRPLRRPVLEDAGQPGHGRVLEQQPQGDLGADLPAQAPGEAGREERVPAQVEEAVVRAHPLEAQDLGEAGGHPPLELGPRLPVLAAESARGERGRRQGAAVDLAVGIERQTVLQDHEGRGHHGAEELAGGVLPELGRRDPFAPPGHDVGDQPQLSRSILPGHHERRSDRRVARERRLHLPHLDPDPPDLDLAVDPAGELERAVRQPTDEIARPVDPRTGAAARGRAPSPAETGLGHEGEGRGRGTPAVPEGQAVAADDQLSGDADRRRREPPVDHPDRGVGDRPADGDRADGGRGAAQAVARRHHAVLGRPVEIDHPGRDARREHPGDRGRVGRLAAERDEAQLPEGRRRLPRHLVEDRGGEQAGGDPQCREGPRERARREDRLALDRHQAGAVGEGAPGLPARRVERRVGDVGHAVAGAELDQAAVAHQTDEGAVRDRHPLGPAGRARRVEHLGGRSGSRRTGKLGHRKAARGGLARVETEDRTRSLLPGGGELLEGRAGVRAPGHQRRSRVFEHEDQARQRVRRVERQVGAARPEHRERRRHLLGRARQAEADHRSRPHPQAHQPLRQGARPLGQPAVGHHAPGDFERRRLRGPRRVLLDEVDQRRLAPKAGGTAPPLDEELMALGGRQRLDLGERPADGHAAQEPDVALPEPAYGGAVEAVGRELHVSADAPPVAAQTDREVELGGPGVDLLDLGAEAGERDDAPRPVVHREGDVKGRPGRAVAGCRRRPLRRLPGEPVLVAERLEHGVAGPGEHLPEGAGPGEAGAQDQRPDEEADQVPGRRHRPAGHHRSHRHVVGAGAAGEEEVERRQQHHERGRPLGPGQLLQAADQVRRQGHRQRGAAAGRASGARAVGGQLERRPGAPCPGGRGAALRRFPLPAPGGVVAELDRRLGERRRAPGGEGFVESRQLADEDPDRGAVRDHVVDRQHQVLHPALPRARAVPAGDPEQPGTKQRSAGEVEGAAGLVPGQALRLAAGGGKGQAPEVDPRQG